MIWQIRAAFAGLAALVISAGAGHAAPWTRGYVVGTYEFAFHYGGRAGFTRAGEIEPGADCPMAAPRIFPIPTM